MSFAIGNSGTLTAAGQVNVPVNGDTLNALTLDPSGSNLYASSMSALLSGSVSTFSVDRSSGKLGVASPDPTNTPMPGRIVVHPSGRFLYAALLIRHHTADDGGFGLYLRDPATGALTFSKKFPQLPLGNVYGDIALAAEGRFILGVTNAPQKVEVFSVNSATGDLTKASELPGTFNGIAADRTGRFVILSDASGAVSSYSVNGDGSLTQVSTAAAAADVSNVVVDARNKFVYVEDPKSPRIFAFTFEVATGKLAAVSGSPFATSGTPIRLATP
jgi:6-phosphogluconolactonase (cycloisomerase 2 family)